MTQNADEWDNLRRYQKKIAVLNEKQRMLEQTDARIAELKGKSDRASRDELIRMQNNARTLARSIERADGELLKYEAMKPIKKLAERQREDYRQKLKARTDERMRKYKERMRQDMQDRIREVRVREAERGKQRLDKAVEHAREVGNRRVDRLKESEAKAKYRERIQKDVSTLREWLTQPTNKGHVPQFLRAPLADFLESLDFTSARALRGGDATKTAAGIGAPLADRTSGNYVYLYSDDDTSRADEIITATGNSMEPTFHDGDALIVEHTQSIRPGEIGIFVAHGEGYVKEYRLPQGHQRKLPDDGNPRRRSPRSA